MASNNEIKTERPAALVADTKVEVTVEGETAVIRMSSYADGIGWFVQKTITVDAEMLDTLADQFCAARANIRRESDEILSAEILEF